ncbi:myosin-M heavy protein [Tasmannia lanceolata]|uniref:myosin-M heavy protein n=1 Tax=Tasmannia lanceolata TaxID=3420 RepID=UPI004062C07A
MGRQYNKPTKPEDFSAGKVTPIQIAFIVDRYLSENNYTKTLSVFRTEASTLISKTKGKEAPKNLLSLGAILEEYIRLKEQKLMVDQEKYRVEVLLQGMQNVMEAYNLAGNVSQMPKMDGSPPCTVPALQTPISQIDMRKGPPAVYPMYNTPIANSMPMHPLAVSEPSNFLTPITNVPSKKRKGSKLVPDVLPSVKKSHTQLPTNQPINGGTKTPLPATNINGACKTVMQFSVVQSTSCNYPPNGSSVQGSSVSKSLFKQSPQSQTDSSGPKTPPQPFPSQADKSVSPMGDSSLVNSTNSNNFMDITPTNCHVISSETVVISPLKHKGCYSVERSHCVSTSPLKSNPRRLSKRDHIKGRLDFDDSNALISSEKPVASDNSTSGDVTEIGDMFDIDIPNFDIFGADFSLSELLVDFDLENEGLSSQSLHNMDPPADIINGLGHESGIGILEANQALFEPPHSTLTTILSEKDMNRQGTDSLMSVKSITKCIQIVSPVKNLRSCSLEQENSYARD